VNCFAFELFAVFVRRVRIPSLAPIFSSQNLRESRLNSHRFAVMLAPMALPAEPVTLSVEQINELNQKISTLRHDVNNNLSLIMATVELIRRRPETAERMWDTLEEQPRKVVESVSQFSRELEALLHITKP
jgi:hypothetical protein